MLYTKQKAFTLVELIVVVTILAILATIGFVSYSSYLTGVRDTNRIAQMTSLSDGLNLYSTTNDLPIPEDNVEVQVNGDLIAYQGYVGANILETINFDKGGVDPKDNTYFSYYLTSDRKYFQMMGFLEESADLTQNSLLNQTYAVDYEDRIPTVTGKKLGILTDLSNNPIQESGITSLDLQLDDTTNYLAHLSNDSILSGDTSGNSDLEELEVLAKAGGKIPKSCKDLLSTVPSLQGNSGEYFLALPNGYGRVYCDMDTDGGGWTFFLHVDGTEVSKNFFEEPTGTYMSNRSDTGEHYSLSSKAYEHTEMMFTASAVDPQTSPNLVFFKYQQGNGMFNKGPIPCSGDIDFQFKQGINETYQQFGTATTCSTGAWYTRSGPDSADYLVLFHSSTSYQGNYFISSPGWAKDGYWYLR